MALERELKFLVPPRAAAAVARALKLPRGRLLQSIYFDTDERILRRARMAARVRRDGRKWLQTVKGARSPGVRNEWEGEVPSRALDTSRLPLASIRRATGVDIGRLELSPVFETRFTRRAKIVIRGKAKIELALDRGYVRAGRRRLAISEIELELKAGSMRDLRREAKLLAQRFKLAPGEESKAARGYRLADGE